MTNEEIAIVQYKNKLPLEPISTRLCGCTGPMYGEPRCPCQMKSVEIVFGKYYEVYNTDGKYSAIYLKDVNFGLQLKKIRDSDKIKNWCLTFEND